MRGKLYTRKEFNGYLHAQYSAVTLRLMQSITLFNVDESWFACSTEVKLYYHSSTKVVNTNDVRLYLVM